MVDQMAIRKRAQRHRFRLGAFRFFPGYVLALLLIAWVGRLWAQDAVAPAPVTSTTYRAGSTYRDAALEAVGGVADGALRSCVMISIDRAFAVGDRGLILSSEDGGKRWNVIASRAEHSFFGIGFEEADPLGVAARGVVVGGRIEPITGRSEGVIEITSDEGKTWKRIPVPGLPRLLGMQRLGYQHWIAWGDWSDHWQSSLFESTDGGVSWSARPLPCGHLRSAAMNGEGKTLLVDRVGRVFYSQDGLDFQTIGIPSNPFGPIRFAKHSELGWWLGGDQGQLYFSQDARNWKRIELPGDGADHALISLKDLVVLGTQVWIVGAPGSVVWCSRDAGLTWRVAMTQQTTPLHSIAVLDNDVLLACGNQGTALISRNGGQAWRALHQAGERVACLALASVERNLPWDVLAYVTHEGKRRAAAIAVHDQSFHDALGQRAEISERITDIGIAMHLEEAKVLPEFPIGNLRTGMRSTDLGYYRNPDVSQEFQAGAPAPLQPSELVRKLVLEVRTHRPDLIVTEDSTSKKSLEAATAVATQQAIQLAASPSYRLFSAASGVELPAWTVQRVMARSEENGGLVLAPSMLMTSSGTLLSDATRRVRYLPTRDTCDSWLGTQRVVYRMTSLRTANIKQPLEGMILDTSTLLVEPILSRKKVSSLLANANASTRAAQLLKLRGSGILAENAWDESLRGFAQELEPSIQLDALGAIAIESRRHGNWHRWNTALNMVIEKAPNSPNAEWAFRELMTHFGSPEVHRVVQEQRASQQTHRANPKETPLGSPGNSMSPFASQDPNVIQVAHERGQRLTPIAQLRGPESFSRLLSRWPNTWQTYRSEPEWAWLITSRYRTSELLRGTAMEESRQSLFWPPDHSQFRSWGSISKQERALAGQVTGADAILRIPNCAQRPFLDGVAEASVWGDALVLPLQSSWSTAGSETLVRLTCDAEFLYLHCRCLQPSPPAHDATSSSKKSPSQARRRDALNSSNDHVRLRIDLDRDYATWFEFAWDREGETFEQCNDMTWWNPVWFVAFHTQPDAWNAEIAIPLESILPRRSDDQAYPAPDPNDSEEVTTASSSRPPWDLSQIDWSSQIWGISMVRERPSEAMESLCESDTDRWSRDQWRFISLSQPLKPEASPERETVVNQPTENEMRR